MSLAVSVNWDYFCSQISHLIGHILFCEACILLDGVPTRGLTVLVIHLAMCMCYRHGSIRGLNFEQVLWMIIEFDVDKHNTVGIKFGISILFYTFKKIVQSRKKVWEPPHQTEACLMIQLQVFLQQLDTLCTVEYLLILVTRSNT